MRKVQHEYVAEMELEYREFTEEGAGSNGVLT